VIQEAVSRTTHSRSALILHFATNEASRRPAGANAIDLEPIALDARLPHGSVKPE